MKSRGVRITVFFVCVPYGGEYTDSIKEPFRGRSCTLCKEFLIQTVRFNAREVTLFSVRISQYYISHTKALKGTVDNFLRSHHWQNLAQVKTRTKFKVAFSLVLFTSNTFFLSVTFFSTCLWNLTRNWGHFSATEPAQFSKKKKKPGRGRTGSSVS